MIEVYFVVQAHNTLVTFDEFEMHLLSYSAANKWTEARNADCGRSYAKLC